MKTKSFNKFPFAVTVALTVLLSACGDSGEVGSGSGAGVAGNGIEANTDTDTDTGQMQQLPASVALDGNDFTFPAVTDANGTTSVSPQGPVPNFSARRTLTAGTGQTIAFGDPVVLRYTMHAWSTGELVESSDDFVDPVVIRAGFTGNSPEYLSKSLLGRRIGERVQVVLRAGTEDLPNGFDTNNAYVVVAELL